MKVSDYFFSSLLLSVGGLLVYGFIQFFWIMLSLFVSSGSLFFLVFLYHTKIKLPVAQELNADKTIDFYSAGIQTTYYTAGMQHDLEATPLKQVNAD